MSTMLRHLLILLILLIWPGPAQSISLDDNARQFLSKRMVDYYDKNSSQAEVLATIARDGNKFPKERIDALHKLSDKLPLFGIQVAKDLLADGSEEVTTLATQVLADSLVMSDHADPKDNANVSPRIQWLNNTHEHTKTLLRKSLEDARPSVRGIAAECLTSLSDKAGLDIIEQGVAKGLYTDTQAINYFGLARPEIGGKKLEPYLKSSSAEAQAAAVSYLGAYADYQEKVRDLALLKKSVPPSVQEMAARTLSKYDKTYSTYAPILDTTLAPDVFHSVMDGYIRQKESTGLVTSEDKNTMRRAIDQYKTVRPEVNLKSLGTRIDGLK